MKIKSSAFNHLQPIPKKYSCDGESVNPPLIITEIPKSAISLVLVMEDLDAVKNKIHWIIWNIPPKWARKVRIKEKLIPYPAVEGINDFDMIGYCGPCPAPQKVHRYRFKVYALDKKLKLSPKAKFEDLKKAIKNSISEKAELIGIYQRSK